MKIARFFALGLIFIAGPVLAAGSIQIKGSLRSVTDKNYEIADGKHIYSVLKSKIPPELSGNLKKLRPGQPVDIWVSFDAIESARQPSSKR